MAGYAKLSLVGFAPGRAREGWIIPVQPLPGTCPCRSLPVRMHVENINGIEE